MLKIFRLFALGLATLCIVPPASAEPVRTITVSYADLDLASPEGRAVLEQRVKVAVRQVCRTRVFHPFVQRAARQDCRDRTSQIARNSVELAIAKANERRQLVQSTKTSRR